MMNSQTDRTLSMWIPDGGGVTVWTDHEGRPVYLCPGHIASRDVYDEGDTFDLMDEYGNVMWTVEVVGWPFTPANSLQAFHTVKVV